MRENNWYKIANEDNIINKTLENIALEKNEFKDMYKKLIELKREYFKDEKNNIDDKKIIEKNKIINYYFSCLKNYLFNNKILKEKQYLSLLTLLDYLKNINANKESSSLAYNNNDNDIKIILLKLNTIEDEMNEFKKLYDLD